MAKRRTPPLFEVLSGPALEVRLPVSGGSSSSAAAEGTRQWNPVGIISIIFAVVLVVGFGIWFVAYQLGQNKQQAIQKEQISNYLDKVSPAPTTVIPTVPTPPVANAPGLGTGVGVATEGPPGPDVGIPAAAPSSDPRRAGNNYLHIVTLSWKEADRAVAYLEKNGIPAAAMPSGPAKAVDPSEARAKNLPHLVFALEAIPSDQYRSTERKRQELVERVRRIGKKWQSEEKGPSDFGEPGWVKFK